MDLSNLWMHSSNVRGGVGGASSLLEILAVVLGLVTWIWMKDVLRSVALRCGEAAQRVFRGHGQVAVCPETCVATLDV